MDEREEMMDLLLAIALTCQTNSDAYKGVTQNRQLKCLCERVKKAENPEARVLTAKLCKEYK